MNMSTSTTELQSRLAQQIVSTARSSGWTSGHHLTEGELQSLFGTSRTPIRAAMAHLEELGVLEKRPNRGYFLKKVPKADLDPPSPEDEQDQERIYLAIAMDRLKHELPDRVSENELIRRYGLTRARMRLVLTRIAAEGWIERTPGRGWQFQSLIDSVDAYRENYAFRRMIEPMAMRSSNFRAERVALDRLKAQQTLVRDRGFETLSQIELFEINSQFHEGLAGMSGNRFIVQTLQRLNQLRRLVEYGRPLDRARVRRVCREHLRILAPLYEGDTKMAATLLDEHIAGATEEKTTR
jgi:DNA-binding GntR family transcriptional regulator